MAKIIITLESGGTIERKYVTNIKFAHGCVYAEDLSRGNEPILRCHTEIDNVVDIKLEDD